MVIRPIKRSMDNCHDARKGNGQAVTMQPIVPASAVHKLSKAAHVLTNPAIASGRARAGPGFSPSLDGPSVGAGR
ncbi:hypothetical protein, partial [Paraburkholderia franconis]|uniref:hypothetical protein n=1 Tax=Paraburkholderia franconis TaxID=2654983 RepID=UPI001D130482